MRLKLFGRSWTAWLAALLLVALSVGDVLTTNYIIGTGGGHEGNPFIAWMMATIGPWWMVVKILATTGIAVWLLAKWNYRLARVAMAIAVGAHCLVVGRHLFLILGGFV